MDQWKEFRIGDIFECSTTKLSIKDELDIGNIPLISRTAMNNGCDGYFDIDPQKVSKGGCITIGAEGIYAFYQAKDFGTGNKVYTIKNKEMNQYSALFICTLLNKEDYKYSYGRARILGKLINETIRLPVNSEGDPDREFMENYIKSLHSKPITTKNKPGKNVFHTDEWKEFRIGDIFDVQLSKGDIKLDEVDKGNIPLISSGEANNGIVGYISEKGDGKASIFQGNTLTVDMFCNAFYQINSFYAVSHGRVNILSAKCRFNQYIGLFLVTLIRQEQLKYSYGRAVYSNETQNMIIKLPVNSEGNPDREYMENYIKNLPYGDRI